MAGKYRMTINGFTCHNETWDDPWQKDGKRDELFFAVNTKIVGRDGTVKRQLSSESDVMGDTNGQPGRIQAGSASDRGGIRTGDRFPDKDRPWEHGDALDGHRYPPYVIWEGDLSDGGDVVLLTPTLWEFDPGGSVIEGWVAWQVETDKTFGQRAKDIVSGKWPITASVFDAVSLGIQTFGSLFGQWGPLGSQGSRPIGLQPDPADPKGVLFNPTIVALSAETAEHLANANEQGLGRGILELVFKDHKDLGGDYSVYLQIEKLTQQAPAPAVGAVGDPFAYSTPFDDTARVIARADNGSILELFYLTGAGWRSANLSALSGAPAALGDPHAYVVPDDQAARLVYRGVDGHVHGLDYQAGRGWAHAGLSARVGAPAATGNPFGYLTPFDGLSRVVYRDANGHIHELYAQSGQSWGYADLSAVTGAPPAASDPVAYITPSDGFARVVYRDAAGHVHELYYKPGQGWGHADLSVATGAPSAAGDPMGYHTPFDDTARVVYRGKDDHVHELYYVSASGWGYADLSALTRAPAATGNPYGYLNPTDGTARVVYRGADNDVHELAYSTGNGWAHADLAQMTGATPAAGDPCGYVTPFDSFARVVYRSADGHVHELYAQSGQSWGHADLS